MLLYRMLIRRWRYLVIAAALGALLVLGLAISTAGPVTYDASASVLMSFDQKSKLGSDAVADLDYITKEAIYLLNNTDFIQQTLSKAGFSAEQADATKVRSTQATGSTIVTTATALSSEAAEQAANAVSQQALAVVEPLNFALKTTPLQTTKVRLNPTVSFATKALAGAVAGLLVMVCFLLLRYYFKDWIRSGEEAAALLRLPVVARLDYRRPGKDGAPPDGNAPAKNGEQLRFLAALVRYRNRTEQGGVICLANPSGAAASREIIYGMAGRLAAAGKKSILIDLAASPSAQAPDPRPGIGEVASGNCALADAAEMRGDLPVLHADGREGAAEPELAALAALLPRLREEYDYVFLNTGSLTACPQMNAAAALADKTLLTIELDNTLSDDAAASTALLQGAGININGCVLVQAG